MYSPVGSGDAPMPGHVQLAFGNEPEAVVDVEDPEASPSESGCRICGSDETPELLIEPCNCSGSLRRVHTTCLKRWILTRPSREEQMASQAADPRALHIRTAPNNEDGRFTCEICHADYRVQVAYTFAFDWKRCCKWRSINHCVELFILLIMLGVCAAMWPLLTKRASEQEQGAFGSEGTDKVVIPVIAVVMIILTLITLWKVYQRWRRANSIIDLIPPGAARGQPLRDALQSGVAVQPDADGELVLTRPQSSDVDEHRIVL